MGTKEHMLTHQIADTIEWAKDVSEMWTGTLYQEIIEHKQGQLIKAVADNDDEAARTYMWELGEILHDAVHAYEN